MEPEQIGLLLSVSPQVALAFVALTASALAGRSLYRTRQARSKTTKPKPNQEEK